MSTARETIVVLRVIDDDHSRKWWQSIGLPDPDRWAEELDGDVYAAIELEEMIR